MARNVGDPKFQLGIRQQAVAFQVVMDLEAIMKRLGMKKTDLAARLQKSRAWVSKALWGGQNMRLSTIVELADAVGMDVEIRFSERHAAGAIVRESETLAVPARPQHLQLVDTREPIRRLQFTGSLPVDRAA